MPGKTTLSILIIFLSWTLCLQANEQDSDRLLEEIRSTAEQMAVFPFQWTIYVGANRLNDMGHQYFDTLFVSEEDEKRYYEFVAKARKADDRQRETAMQAFDSLSAKEKILVFVAIFLSGKREYLPFFAEHIIDRQELETMSWEERSEALGPIRTRFADGQSGWFDIFDKSKQDKLPRYERKMRYAIWYYNTSGVGPKFDNSIYEMKTVGCYANAIVRLWGCNPIFPGTYADDELNIQRLKDYFSEEFWKTLAERKLFGRMQRIRYLIEVETAPPEEYEKRLKEYIDDLTENNSPLQTVFAIYGIYRGNLPFNTRVYTPLLDRLYPEYEVPYEKISKEEFIKLLCDDTWNENDEEFRLVDKEDWRNTTHPTLLLMETMRRYKTWVSVEEMDALLPNMHKKATEGWKNIKKHPEGDVDHSRRQTVGSLKNPFNPNCA